LSERRGADSFTLPVALKFFSPEAFPDERSYHDAMQRMAHVSSRVALIQHDNLLDVQNFVERNRIRVLEMEWVDGYDLDSLLAPGMLDRARGRVGQKRWDYINRVIATAGQGRIRLKAGMAVAIIREVLAGLAALHREEIVHGDIKPSNIMVKRTGNAKIIDIGSAIDLNNMPQDKTCTPQYAAPEILDREEVTPRSDLASVGYVLVELLAGKPLFAGIREYANLLEAKRTLPQRLANHLPREVRQSDLLMTICRRLTAPDPMLRYATAEHADTGSEGLAEFQRTLVRGDLASEYENELRVWLEELD
jgi:serine/threonine-protein kinase